MAETTFKQAKAELKNIGITLTKKDGEYRVSQTNLEAKVRGISTYYTDNLEDALRTGHAMAPTTDLAPHCKKTKADFIAFLRDTLIPDLRESGSDCTADDFEDAIHFMEVR